MYQSLSLSRSSSENTPVCKTSCPRASLKHIVEADQLIEDNYKPLQNQGIQTTRVAISWQQAEKIPYFYNWDAVTTGLENTKAHGTEPVWDLCYLGIPDNLTPLHLNFVRRFAAFCRAFVRYYKHKQPNAILTVAAIDENAFLSSEIFTSNHQESVAILNKACAEAVSAMKEEDPNICVLDSQSITNIISLLNEPLANNVKLAIAS